MESILPLSHRGVGPTYFGAGLYVRGRKYTPGIYNNFLDLTSFSFSQKKKKKNTLFLYNYTPHQLHGFFEVSHIYSDYFLCNSLCTGVNLI